MQNEMARVGPRDELYRLFCVKQSGFDVFRFVGGVLLVRCLVYCQKQEKKFPQTFQQDCWKNFSFSKRSSGL
jgi:hypothetical protein